MSDVILRVNFCSPKQKYKAEFLGNLTKHALCLLHNQFSRQQAVYNLLFGIYRQGFICG